MRRAKRARSPAGPGPPAAIPPRRARNWRANAPTSARLPSSHRGRRSSSSNSLGRSECFVSTVAAGQEPPACVGHHGGRRQGRHRRRPNLADQAGSERVDSEETADAQAPVAELHLLAHPEVILLSLGAAMLMGLTSVLRHSAAATVDTKHSLRPRLLLELLRRPGWLLGNLAHVGALALQFWLLDGDRCWWSRPC